MLFIVRYGQLGNQLIQYAALKKLFPEQKLVLIGFDELGTFLCGVDATVVKQSRLPLVFRFKYANGIIRRLAAVLSMLRVFSSIQESRRGGCYEISTQRGLLSRAICVCNSFFQNSEILTNLPVRLEIQEDLVNSAREWLISKGATLERQKLVFVHIRRGDYCSWPDPEFPAVLEPQWYLAAMNRLRTLIDSPLFVLISDDFAYARTQFGRLPDVLVSDNDQFIDLALMSLCSHGILSASSFAWWGAWFSRVSGDTESDGVYIAPKYWAGHRKKEWYPAGFQFDWITYWE